MKGTADITIACTLNTIDTNAIANVAEHADYFVNHPLISHTELVDAQNNAIIVRLFFETDLDDDQIQNVVSECDYHVTHEYVTSTEIIDVE